jgi:hypothetical protein
MKYCRNSPYLTVIRTTSEQSWCILSDLGLYAPFWLTETDFKDDTEIYVAHI